MATWNGVITNAGNSLLNEWVNEKTLNFDSAAAGQGTVAAAAMMAQTALVNEKQTASLLGGERVSSGIRLKLRIAAPNTAYTLNQFRVSASVDGGASAMIALFQLEQGVPIPSKTESPDFVYTFYALISCSNTGTWTVTVDTSACVTQSDMSAAIAEAVKTKQDKIMVKGLLLGDGNGNISAAVAGKDYGYPLATGSGAPTDTTEGTAGQHYYDSATGKEYVCSGKDSSGKRLRKQLEVDFVVNQASQRYYIQVAYDLTSEEKQAQEFNSLRHIPDSFKKIVIVNGVRKPWRNDEGFVIMGMKYFLLNADSLEF